MEVLVWGRTASMELARAEGHRERSGADEAGALLLNTSCAQLIEPGALLQLANVVGTPQLGCVEYQDYELYFSAALRNE